MTREEAIKSLQEQLPWVKTQAGIESGKHWSEEETDAIIVALFADIHNNPLDYTRKDREAVERAASSASVSSDGTDSSETRGPHST